MATVTNGSPLRGGARWPVEPSTFLAEQPPPPPSSPPSQQQHFTRVHLADEMAGRRNKLAATSQTTTNSYSTSGDDDYEDGEHNNNKPYLTDSSTKLKRRHRRDSASQWRRPLESTWLRLALFLVLLNLTIYWAPMGDNQPDVWLKVAPERPRPSYSLGGPLQQNELLEQHAHLLFSRQFQGPESMAWLRLEDDPTFRGFFTGVEGGFVLLVEPESNRWSIVARLNAREQVRDLASNRAGAAGNASTWVPYCERDVQLYGQLAIDQPGLISMSRCSRPLGIRLSPTQRYLYVNDPLSGLYLVELDETRRRAAQVSRLLDFAQFQQNKPPAQAEPTGAPMVVKFADDIAVRWAANEAANSSDLIYMTDCSQRWTLRYLFRLMFEYDDTGRVLTFDVGSRRLSELPVGHAQLGGDSPNAATDPRNLSFPNGIELSSNGSALLLSDLNNRRILMHHLSGPLAGSTRQLLVAPGYSDNIRRGLDTRQGRPTYWAACGCGVEDGPFEMAEFFNNWPRVRKVGLKTLEFVGHALELLARPLGWTQLEDLGLGIRSAWFKHDPICTRGMVFQFDETGALLRSLHAPRFGSDFRLLSEASERPHPSKPDRSILYLGSVYYPYLGRIELERFPE